MVRTKNPAPKRFVSKQRQTMRERERAQNALLRRVFHTEHTRTTGREARLQDLHENRRLTNVFTREALLAAPLMTLRRNKLFLAERAGYGRPNFDGGDEEENAHRPPTAMDEISENAERVKNFEKEAEEIIKRKEEEKKAVERKGVPSVEEVRKQIKYMIILHGEAVQEKTKSDYPIMLTKQPVGYGRRGKKRHTSSSFTPASSVGGSVKI